MSEPTLKSLKDRAAVLEIEGRSTMEREELVQAIAAAELEQNGNSVTTATTESVASPSFPTSAETGRPALADVATARAERRASTRRVLDVADTTQEG